MFAANFVPFRSPNWRSLPNPEGALAFSRELWGGLIHRLSARLYCSLSKRAGQEIAALLGAKYVSSDKVLWGVQTIDHYPDAHGRVGLALPYLRPVQAV